MLKISARISAFTFILALILGLSGNALSSNEAYVQQVGYPYTITVGAQVIQIGDGNLITGPGITTQPVVGPSGEIIGYGYAEALYQENIQNDLIAIQTGDSNTLSLTQTGSGSFSDAFVDQDGNGNVVVGANPGADGPSHAGIHTFATLKTAGDPEDRPATQYSYGAVGTNIFGVDQNGSFNNVGLYQYSTNDNTAVFEQIDDDNNAIVYQDGGNNLTSVYQNGIGGSHNLQVYQLNDVGNDNILGIDQDSSGL
ncbi:hypothetical protein GF312_03115 [Candidatus Poribacteria bacterium]|nr:hypothetical protein [Candidatus Poribacteria bacterium]